MANGATSIAKPRAFLTGASGFVGAAVARALLARGHPVTALVRKSSPRDNLEGLGLDVVAGDMRDRGAVTEAMAGAKIGFHVAADYRLWAPKPGDIITANVAGTRTVMEAALKAGLERIVYTSSVATLRIPASGAADETTPLTESEAIGAYKKSKVAAERLVESLVEREELPAVIVNPSTPIGPRDVKPTPTGRIIIEAATGRIPAFVDTGLNLVHVDDVANGHLLALDKGRVGERYILGGEDLEFADLVGRIARMVGRRAPTLRLPRRALFPLAYGAEAVARVTGREPFITVDGLKMARYRMFFSSAKATAELGYTARPVDEALADALAWFRAHGRLA
jgi:dihydroflavonol-4-reductase